MLKKNLKIGVYAYSLTARNTGVGRYTSEVLRPMLNNSPHQWFVYAHCPLYAPEQWQDLAINWRISNWPRSISYLLWEQIVLPYLVWRDKIDVLWFPLPRAPLFLSVPLVLTVYDFVWLRLPSSMKSPLKTKFDEISQMHSLPRADKILCISQSTADDLACVLPSCADKTQVTHLGHSQGKFSDLERRNEFGQYILVVGTIELRKNIARIVAAYSKLPEDIQLQHSLLFVGGQGWGGVDLPQLIEQYQLSKHVRYLNYVDDRTLSALYQNCYFLAMPALYEGFGLPLVEAMYYGKPILTSANSPMPEVAGDAALYVNPLKTEEITTAMLRLCCDYDLYRQLQINAKIRSESFTWEKTAAQTLLALEEITWRTSNYSFTQARNRD